VTQCSVHSLDDLKPLEIWMAPHGVQMSSAHTEWAGSSAFQGQNTRMVCIRAAWLILVVWNEITYGQVNFVIEKERRMVYEILLARHPRLAWLLNMVCWK